MRIASTLPHPDVADDDVIGAGHVVRWIALGLASWSTIGLIALAIASI